MARVLSVYMARESVRHEQKEKKDMCSRTGKWNWVVLVVILLGLLSSLASAVGTDSADAAVATEEKISIIPEPITLLVLVVALMLFSWKRTHKSRSRSVATGTRG